MQLCQAFEQGPVKHEEKYTLMIVNGLPQFVLAQEDKEILHT